MSGNPEECRQHALKTTNPILKDSFFETAQRSRLATDLEAMNRTIEAWAALSSEAEVPRAKPRRRMIGYSSRFKERGRWRTWETVRTYRRPMTKSTNCALPDQLITASRTKTAPFRFIACAWMEYAFPGA